MELNNKILKVKNRKFEKREKVFSIPPSESSNKEHKSFKDNET